MPGITLGAGAHSVGAQQPVSGRAVKAPAKSSVPDYQPRGAWASAITPISMVLMINVIVLLGSSFLFADCSVAVSASEQIWWPIPRFLWGGDEGAPMQFAKLGVEGDSSCGTIPYYIRHN